MRQLNQSESLHISNKDCNKSKREHLTLSTSWYGFGCKEDNVVKYKWLYILISLILIISVSYKLCIVTWIQDYNFGSIQELMISYGGGVVRRGLLGELIYQLIVATNINELQVILALCVTAYLFVTCTLVYFFVKRRYSWWIIASPFMCGMVLFIIRKDFILYSIFIISILILRENVSGTKYLAAILLTVFAILTHEAYVFWGVPLVTIAMIAKRYKTSNYVAFLLISLCAFGLMSYFKGSYDVAHQIVDAWNPVLQHSQLTYMYTGPIGALGWDLSYAIDFHLHKNFHSGTFGWSYAILRPLCLLLGYWLVTNILFTLRGHNTSVVGSSKNVLSCLVATGYLCMIPMFTVLSCDFGRSVQHISIAAFSLFMIFDEKDLNAALHPKLKKVINGLDKILCKLLKPSYVLIILALLFVAEIPYEHNLLIGFVQSPVGSLLQAAGLPCTGG